MATDALGDIVYLELPEVGASLGIQGSVAETVYTLPVIAEDR